MGGALCVITARGGSKRVPRKNVRDFCGRPIIAYSIEAALASGVFDEVMVSTDDAEIAEVSRGCGAEVPFMRGAATSGDYATTADVLIEVLGSYDGMGRDFEVVGCVYPTAPFVTAGKLREAMRLYRESGADAVLTATRFSFPPQRGFVERDGHLSWWMPEYADARSQDLEPILHDAGQLYLRDVAGLRSTGSLLGNRTVAYEVPETEAQDIDSETDWQIAEMKFERMVRR